ncbi:MAG: DEAD/DEAH box helicase family protein [Armatimonadetes bacterium]|nr:DEAD/DEAH box helicase family protein [Armatimonadota bacterium]
MLDALGRLIEESKALDVATGYFEVGALLDLDGKWQRLQAIRLLMGDEVSRNTKMAFVAALKDRAANGIERCQERDDWEALTGLEAVRSAIASGRIETRVYTRAKFHAKAYHFKTGGVVNHGIIGSSNFTHPGLTQNIELNLFTSDKTHLDEVAKWFEQAWGEAEEIREELLAIIEPHLREYFPFEIYVQAMREYFRDRESDQSGWEQSESKIYPLLATYQRDAYHDLMEMATEHGGALLCDGVGLGKTFVGLMLIERARMERKKILIVAPKSAIPSVWARNLTRYFPDDFGRYTDDIRVMAHTDFGRDGGVTDEEVVKLRQRYETIIIDEAHHFRMPHRNRSRRLKLLTKGTRTFLLTATPINNTLLDLYNLVNLISQDRQNHFQKIGVPHLRNWFNKAISEQQEDQLELQFLDDPAYQDFLKHIIVQRSRKYVKSLEAQEDDQVKFPKREKPVVIDYSLAGVYGELLPELFSAFDSQRARLKLVLYETEKFKEESQRDASTLQDQSNVVGLVRTMLLKRLESSQKALEASVEDLLLKHIVLLKDLQPIMFETWYSEYSELYATLEKHRQERLGSDETSEEEDDLPLTNYEIKKLNKVREDLKEFGRNERDWITLLESDIRVLSSLLNGLHAVTGPNHDAKLDALLTAIKSNSDLSEKKFVIFSEFKDTARYLEEQLKRHFDPKEIIEVDSGRNVKRREDIIKRFAPHYNCEDDVDLQKALAEPIRILVTTDVLSEGLNLQDANQIINYDLHWNPVRLMQRIGRVDRRMDPRKPVDYNKVHVYNFLPPAELEPILQLYTRVSGKLIAINKTLGIEAPVLTADDDFKAMDFYQNLGDFTMSPQEQVRLKAHELEAKHPELWAESHQFPSRIYSGKPGSGKKLFLAYRVHTGFKDDDQSGETLTDVKWFLVDSETDKIVESLPEIHAQIECAEGTARNIDMPKEERTRLRKLVENGPLATHRFRAGIAADHKDELICWMEI